MFDKNEFSAKEIDIIKEFNDALTLLDDYDHGNIGKPKGNKSVYQLTYKECRNLIDKMSFSKTSEVFGIEKENGKLEGILAAIHQTAFNKDVYDTLEEKAANLLYFLIKDHPFADGCKRIGAAIFLEFLNKNNAIKKDDKLIISNSALVAMTLLIAESKPEEKEIMIHLIMNFLI